jgi:hypothetical protein
VAGARLTATASITGSRRLTLVTSQDHVVPAAGRERNPHRPDGPGKRLMPAPAGRV